MTRADIAARIAAEDQENAQGIAEAREATLHVVGTPCWHCHGYGYVLTGHDSRGEDVTRQCGACDGWGYR